MKLIILDRDGVINYGTAPVGIQKLVSSEPRVWRIHNTMPESAEFDDTVDGTVSAAQAAMNSGVYKRYIETPDDWKAMPGSLEAIALLNRAGYTVTVATNQSGVGRGYYTETGLAQIHQKMAACLREKGGVVDKIFYCPHHPDDHCRCRKPAVGLFEQIAATYGVALEHVCAVGDSWCDIQAAEQAACKPILVLTGNGQETLSGHPELHTRISIFSDLWAVAQALLEQNGPCS